VIAMSLNKKIERITYNIETTLWNDRYYYLASPHLKEDLFFLQPQDYSLRATRQP
jgi:hypothetical protein